MFRRSPTWTVKVRDRGSSPREEQFKVQSRKRQIRVQCTTAVRDSQFTGEDLGRACKKVVNLRLKIGDLRSAGELRGLGRIRPLEICGHKPPPGNTPGGATRAEFDQDLAGEDVAMEFRLFVQELKGLQADSGVERNR
jgi:hypothetical protein